MTLTEPTWLAPARAWAEKHIRRCQCGGVGFVYADVEQSDPIWGKAVPCVCQRDREAGEHAARLRRLSGIPEVQLRERTFEAFETRLCQPPECRKAMDGVKVLCQGYAKAPRGWLVIVGPVGSGKTHLAQAIARYRIDQGDSTYMASMPDLLDMLRAAYDDEVADFETRFGLLRDVGLLVLDDLGAERGTDWSREKLYQLVNWRYEHRKPMVVTSNVRLSELGDATDERIVSRLSEGAYVAGGWSRILELSCGDFRMRRKG